MGRTEIQSASLQLQAVCREVGRKVVGQAQVIHHTVAACVAGGHVLFEDVPGTGKTTLAAAVAKVLGLEFGRVQGTPDLLPSELVGTMVFHPGEGSFSFRNGPIFTQVLLMDEINRATPRTQSALLEAMAEGQVSVDGVSHLLKQPFFVMATANPIESQGVFPLPEAQLDRFLVQLRLGYTTQDEEIDMIERIRLGEGVELTPQMDAEQLLTARQTAAGVHVSKEVLQYIVALCRGTRSHEQIQLGPSPRAAVLLTAFTQALALLDGRDFVRPDDVQAAWLPVMRHRIRTFVDWQGDGAAETEAVLTELLENTLVPTEFVQGV
jgi:MoxR-like ATPase